MILNPLRLLNYFRIEPKDVAGSSEILWRTPAVGGELAKDETVKHVRARIGKVVYDIFLRLNEYQIQTKDPRTPLVGEKVAGKVEVKATNVNLGSIDPSAWKKHSGPDISKAELEETAIVGLSLKLLVQEKNYKVVKFAKWCGRGVTSITSSVTKPRLKQAAFLVTAFAVCGISAFYLQKQKLNPLSFLSRACGYTVNVMNSSNITAPQEPEDWTELGNLMWNTFSKFIKTKF